MKYDIHIEPRTFHFIQPAGTSRGVYHERHSWFLYITSPEHPEMKPGMGECAPLPDLSCDACPGTYQAELERLCHHFTQTGVIDFELFENYPSMLFGLETALLHFQNQSLRFYDTSFSRGEVGIPINGLVWMGDYDEMYHRIQEKLNKGFTCIKLKIGAIDFDQELALLRYIRSSFSEQDVTLRVDANGAFSPTDALSKLEKLAQLGIHSIEQPIKAGQWEEMRKLQTESPIPIALDEELIGINTLKQKEELMAFIQPHFIILKPSLHGGIKGCNEWITLAQKYGIGYWITSALESNIGLNAIAQWTAAIHEVPITLPQGLGTGLLFHDNVPVPLAIKHDQLWFNFPTK